ncbi:BON domain-containing protein [Actinoplanes bogorensis]|uniref:BON domain-containing protein n=1 Tax=Paractinoplanes bogorensis TaxID=1610840 RepID=A0ABS5Z5G3_9ACTN|nr:BON domain-containing protein [Actinoplanes bogorensis]MBU2670931.1 BON domain-containing protein [Actinoplanes bogorensis]
MGDDAELARRVAETFAADERFRRQPVAVQVQNGVVILTGTVESPEVYDSLTAVVRKTDGVRDLCDGLLVRDGARQFGELAAQLALAPASTRRTRRGAPAAVAARAIMIATAVVIVLIEVAGWLAALFGVGMLAWLADILLRRRER